MGGLREEGHEKIGEDERWREGAADRKLGKKEQKDWLDNILPDPHPCIAGNKEEEHIYIYICVYIYIYIYIYNNN